MTSRMLEPTGLTVLYDAACPVCRRARRWAERQHHLVPVEFLPAGTAEARRRFPLLDPTDTQREITVVSGDGAVFRDEHAWLSVLWAIRSTRPTASRLARRRRRPLFRTVKSAAETVRAITSADDDSETAAACAAWPPPRA